jgi:8-oxo-dGTP diphosphatase
MEEKYLFCVPQKALIEKDNKFLIIKRSENAKNYPMHWDLPGGKLEHGETHGEGLMREVLEETNLIVKVKDPIFSYIETKGVFAYVVVYEAEFLSGELKLSTEHSEYMWATREELKELLIEPYLAKLFLEK